MSAYFHSYLCGRKAAEWLIYMKEIKIELLGIATILLGITLTTNNFFGYILGALGFGVTVVGCFLKDKDR